MVETLIRCPTISDREWSVSRLTNLHKFVSSKFYRYADYKVWVLAGANTKEMADDICESSIVKEALRLGDSFRIKHLSPNDIVRSVEMIDSMEKGA